MRASLPTGVTVAGARETLDRLLATKGELRTSEALLVVATWLARAGMAVVPAATMRDVYPDGAPALGTMPHYLQHLVSVGLLERIAPAVFRPTPLGQSIADALPDRDRVKALRHLQIRPPGRTATA